MRENPVFSRVLRKSFKRKTVEKMGKNSRSILCLSITRFSCTQQKSSISCWVMVIIIHCSPDLTRGCCLKGLHLNLMPRNAPSQSVVILIVCESPSHHISKPTASPISLILKYELPLILYAVIAVLRSFT